MYMYCTTHYLLTQEALDVFTGMHCTRVLRIDTDTLFFLLFSSFLYMSICLRTIFWHILGLAGPHAYVGIKERPCLTKQKMKMIIPISLLFNAQGPWLFFSVVSEHLE
jgi:hypothetical protein